ncbi:hypothetical protein MA6G0728R_0853 [Mycobacteroides abscessus 6G-0728-R]|uniref:Uncharacterized protein n=1 Tax=Mycobacteroides abscessus 1948 TaxID=1299323 RepID=A0A829QQH1_9MYCO|nr:hypothetical protein MA6G0125R_5122 [Mycobacteroides abscessus 6G-0125-R]EIU50617.1 hypothetical protein MA6G0125S_0860 [Mycobacteroides abscessus 6G-0125-S]EIU56166.1 hypothetical protein MA6G0728S_1190 [Mycobacteroides abscessus 6G-0728-S]EIU66471.1 hypothetical protein MA6G1108_0850 [Mycobacteroides abscessus 6G-1108]EIU98768.1 hypothetical protein MA6G0212_0921 [Mycobacteroides abscessus 6G-0212]EIV02851.1 hypothetical protein MA6G0728R_0853 [Mycobacteroides abscessus 6G-0728-R]EIV2920
MFRRVPTAQSCHEQAVNTAAPTNDVASQFALTPKRVCDLLGIPRGLTLEHN